MRAVRSVFTALGWIVVVVIALVVSVYGHMYTDLARGVVLDEALGAINPALRGRIEAGRLAELSPSRIRLVDVVIYDPQERAVIRAREVLVRPDLEAIVGGTIRLDAAEASRGHVRLLETPGGGLSIAEAFEPTEPEPDTGAPAPTVIVDGIHLADIAVETSYAPVGLAGTTLRGALRVEDGQTDVRVRSGRAGILANGRRAGRIAEIDGHLDLTPDATSRLGLVLRSGDDRLTMAADAVLQPADPGSSARFDAELQLDPLSAATLRRAGLPEVADQLDTWVRVRLTVAGTPDDLEASGDLDTDGGPIHLDARLTGMRHVHAAVRTEGLELGALGPSLPSMRVSGEVEADLVPLETSPREISVSVRSLAVDRYRVPSLDVDATLFDDHVRIRRVNAPYLTGDLDVRGRVGFDGDVDLHVRARVPELGREPNLRMMLPTIGGALRTDARIRYRTGPEPHLAFDGEATLSAARIADVRIGRLHVEGTARGRPERPRLDARVTASGLQVGSVEIGNLRLRAEGGPHRYAVALDVDTSEPARRLRVAGTVRATEKAYDLTAERLEIGVAGQDWQGEAAHVRFAPERALEVEGLRLASGDARLELDGTYGLGPGPQVALRAVLQRVDLDLLDAIPGMDDVPLEGKVDLTAEARGDAAAPDVSVEGAWLEGRAQGVPIDPGKFLVRWQPSEGSLQGEIDLRLGDRYGRVSLRVDGELDRTDPEPIEALMDGTYAVEMTLHDVAPEVAGLVAPGTVPEIGGRLGGSIVAEGTPRDFSLGTTLNARDLEVEGYGPADASVTASYEAGTARARVELDIDGEDFGWVWGSAELDLPALAWEPETATARLTATPGELHVRVPPRRLDRLPPWLSAHVDVPARAWLRADVRRVAGRPTEADLQAGMTWLGRLDPTTGDADADCAGGARPRATLEGTLRDGAAEVHVGGFMHRKRVLGAKATAAAPVDDWLEGGLPSGPPAVDLRARVVEADLDRMPYLCRYASGPLSAELTARGLFGAEPSLEMSAHSPRLTAMNGPPFDLDLQAGAGSERAETKIRLRGLKGDHGARVHASIPVTWDAERPLPVWREDGRFDGELALDRMPLAPLLAPVPGISYAAGVLDGRVQAEGRGRDVQLDGALALHDVSVSMLGPGNRLDDVGGRILFDRHTIRLENLRAHDRGGRVTVDGSVDMEGLAPKRGRFEVKADEFPVRNAGVIMARLTTKADLDMRFGDEEGRVGVALSDMRVALKSASPPELQALEGHPDVAIVGPDGEIQRRARAEPPADPEDPYVYLIDVKTTDPFWVRRADMAAQLEARLRVRVAEQVHISGDVELVRGFFELMGKRFELEEGQIHFTGADKVDPAVRLVATHDLGGGEVLTVTITGNMTNPELAFSSSSGDVKTMADAVAKLMGGRRGGATDQSVSAEAASMLSGVTAGILTTTLRRELGGMFPVISVEAGDRAGGGKVRAGIDADRIIPDFMEGFVTGAYVEGFVGTGQEASGSQGGTSTGVLVEFRYPHDITSTVTFEPPQSWSLDLMWEP